MPRPITDPKGFIPVPGVAQADMVYSYLGQKVENVYHIMKGSGGTPFTVAELTGIASDLEAWESATARNHRNGNCVLNEIIVRDLTSISAPAISQVPVSPVTGLVSGNPLPGGSALAIKWSTALRGRSFRGRTYHFGITQTETLGNIMAPGVTAALVAMYSALKTQVESRAGMHLVVVSYSAQKQWRDVGLATPITAPSADNDVDSMRRRLNGRGT